MRRVLVTGATGFIGRHAIPLLQQRGFEVHAISRRPQAAAGGVAWHEADLSDAAAVDALMRELRPTHLLHLAWETAHGSYYTTPRNVVWLRDSLTLCDAFVRAGGRRIVGAGSSAEYELYTGKPFHEESTPLRPNGLYGQCKKALGEVLSSLGAQTGVEVAWGRVFFCYGPQEDPGRAIPKVLREVLAGKEVPFTAGESLRDYLHVRDVADAFAELAASSFQGAVNIGSGEGVRLRDLLARFAEAAGRPDAIRFGALPTPSYEPSLVVADATRMRERVGWTPKVALDEGIAETVAWWRRRDAEVRA